MIKGDKGAEPCLDNGYVPGRARLSAFTMPSHRSPKHV